MDWQKVAEQLAEAAQDWLDAKTERENMNLPFGATPLTHPEIFNKALVRAKDAGAKLEDALETYKKAKDAVAD